MRYVMSFSYDGSCFYGYEKQPKLKTVEGSIEDILTTVNNNKKVSIQASGRTDKGVHAIEQVAHFDLDVNINLYGLKKLLNKRLNGEIYINNIDIVNDNFHARYDCIEKTYVYYINIGNYDVFKRNYIYQYNKELDILKMEDAINCFLGKHDFRSFCKEEKKRENCIRNISSVSLDIDNDLIIIRFTGDGFLRKMVRNMVGILIEVGCGKKNKMDILDLLNSCGLKKCPKGVPGCGLYLEKVKYKDGVEVK